VLRRRAEEVMATAHSFGWRGWWLMMQALLFSCAAGVVAAEPGATRHPLSREQALSRLQSPQAEMRQSALVRLAEVGRMQDVPAMLARLKDEDGDVRETAELALWSVWSRSGDAKIDELLAHGTLAMNMGQFEQALRDFDQVVRSKPDFAEGWNKRATVHFLMGENGKSLADCAEVIKRNPRHFGALSGYGQLYMRLGEPEKALEYFERAYAINPGMQGVAENIDILKRGLEQRRRRMI
jgi:tetratricopeptide (TPR) repeat protein